jgi:hypothetical protein
MTMEDSWTLFAAQNPHGKAKEFLRKLHAIWARAVIKFHQTSFRPKKFKEYWFEGVSNYKPSFMFHILFLNLSYKGIRGL